MTTRKFAPVDHTRPMELDDGTPVEFVAFEADYSYILVKAQGSHRRDHHNPSGIAWRYHAATGQWRGANNNPVYKVLRNVQPKIDWSKPIEDENGRPRVLSRSFGPSDDKTYVVRLEGAGHSGDFGGNYFNAEGYRAGPSASSAPSGQLRNRAEPTKPFDPTKPCRTLGGEEVEILSTTAGPSGDEVVYQLKRDWSVMRVDRDGRSLLTGAESVFSLVNIPEEVVRYYRAFSGTRSFGSPSSKPPSLSNGSPDPSPYLKATFTDGVLTAAEVINP